MRDQREERIIVNRYKLLEKVGVGGMGDIYLADDLQLSRQVAIKTIRNELKENAEVRKRIDRECNLHATLGIHPNIVALHDRIDQNGVIYLVMEFVKGETLTSRLKRDREEGRSLSLDQIGLLVGQVLDALSHIHGNEILHRDIKPSNIMLVDKESGTISAKLMDFGIAALDSDDPAATQITTLVTGGPGTPAYMAPERIDSDTFGESGPATDLYSVGVILYELLGDSPPFQGTMTEIFTGHLAREPNLTALSESVPDQLLAVLNRSLEKKQTKRFQDARSFAEALKKSIAGSLPVGAPSAGFGNEALDLTVLATGQHIEAIKEAVAGADVARQRKDKKSGLLIGGVVIALLVIGSTFGGYYYYSGRHEVSGDAGSKVPLSGEESPRETLSEEEQEGEQQTTIPLMSSTKEVGVLQEQDVGQLPQTKILELEPIQSVGGAHAEQAITTSPSKTAISSLEQGYMVPQADNDENGDAMEALLKYRSVEKKKQSQSQKSRAIIPNDSKPATPVKQPSSSDNGGWEMLENTTRKLTL